MIGRMSPQFGCARVISFSSGLLLLFVCTAGHAAPLMGQAQDPASRPNSLAQLNESAQDAPKERSAALRAEAEQAEAQGRSADALAAYEAAVRIAPSDAQLYLRIGLLRGKAGDFENAKKAFVRAIELQSNFAEAHYNLGLTMVGGPQQVPAWKDALREFEAALALRSGYVEALNMSGVCMLESGEPAEAAKRFRAALQSKADSASIHFNLGRALEASGHLQEALDEYTTSAKQNSLYAEAEIAIGNLLQAKEEYRASVEHFQSALAANPDIREAHYKLAQALRHTGEEQAVRVELRQAAALIKRQSDAVMSSHLSNESLNRAKLGDVSGAIQDAKKSLWLDPSNSIADYNLGLLLADAGNFEGAAFQIRKAISLAPLRSSFYVSLARVEEKAGNPRKARDVLERAMNLNPGDPDIKKEIENPEMSRVLTQPTATTVDSSMEFPFGAVADTADGHLAFATQLSKEGDFLGSVGELLRASAMRPERSDLRYNLAVAWAQLGQLDQAELEFRKALLQSPSDVRTRIALGSLLLAAKDCLGAVAEFRRALEIQPANQEAVHLLEQCPATSK